MAIVALTPPRRVRFAVPRGSAAWRAFAIQAAVLVLIAVAVLLWQCARGVASLPSLSIAVRQLVFSVVDIAGKFVTRTIHVGAPLSHPEGLAVDDLHDRAYVAVAAGPVASGATVAELSWLSAS